MPKYTYVYFNYRGRGEVPRLMFSVASEKFVDKRIELADWPKLKPEVEFGQLPYLDVNGKRFTESICICRYIATKLRILGRNDTEKIRADIIVDKCVGIREAVIEHYYEKDETKKAILNTRLQENVARVFTFIEKVLTKNSKGHGLLVGNQLTWADIVLFDLCACPAIAEAVNNHPKVKGHFDKMADLEKMSDYVARRPKTDL